MRVIVAYVVKCGPWYADGRRGWTKRQRDAFKFATAAVDSRGTRAHLIRANDHAASWNCEHRSKVAADLIRSTFGIEVPERRPVDRAARVVRITRELVDRHAERAT